MRIHSEIGHSKVGRTPGIAAAIALLLGACAADAARDDTLDDAGQASPGSAQEWLSLVDGSRLDAWRGFKREDVPANWSAADGTLTFTPGDDGGDLITKDVFEDFELELEWRISEGGNSGIFYHVMESDEYDFVWQTGPEMQVLDNAGHSDGQLPETSAGSDFAVHPPVRDVTRPVGEWNQARLVVRGPHVEHWLNGEKLLEFERWTDQWRTDVAATKFVDMPGYGLAVEGHIALQDHGNSVWFRNVRIRRLVD